MDDHAAETMVPTREQRALAVLRFALGVMFVWVFFENLGKGAYSPAGYKGVIDFFLKNGHAPAIWKGVMSAAAANSSVAGPLQAVTELGFGLLLLSGTATRLVAAAAGAFLFTLWVSELGAAWILGAGDANHRRLLSLRGASRTHLGRGRPARPQDSELAPRIA